MLSQSLYLWYFSCLSSPPRLPLPMMMPDCLSYYPIKDRPPTQTHPAEYTPSETREQLLYAIRETGAFKPTERKQKINAYTAPAEEEEEHQPKKKRRSRRKKRQAIDPIVFREKAGELWRVVQEGLKQGTDDGTTVDGRDMKTPRELANAFQGKQELKLYDYQLHAIKRTLDRIKAGEYATLIAYGMGLGKTLVVIALYVILKKDYAGFGLDWNSTEGAQPNGGQVTPAFDPVRHVQGGVLIVVPADLIPMWTEQLRVRLEHPPKVLVYHGGQGHGGTIAHTPEELAAADIVITSYETLRSDYDDVKGSAESFEDFLQRSIRGHYPTFVIYWRFLVLDEAHKIANDQTGVNKAVNSVRALLRLPLTGTPFLNEYTDILSLLQLMRVSPFEDRKLFASLFLLSPPDKETAYRTLSGPLNAILSLVIRACALRLDRGDRFDKEVIGKNLREHHKDHWHNLLPDEHDAQDEVRQIWDKSFKQDMVDGEAGDADQEILKLMTFARLAAVHPECADAKYGEKGNVESYVPPLEGDAVERVLLGEDAPPPVSRRVMRNIASRRKSFRAKLADGAWGSSRINKVLEIIEGHIKNGKRSGKIIVFSDFLCTLDALEVGLKESGYDDILRFDGTMDTQERKAVVHKFENEPQRHVLLITCRSGGLGRSFIPADCVIHLTPCYSPSLTRQCTDRVVRYPQEKDVYVHYLYANESIEVRVYDLRNQKQGKAAGLLDPDSEVLASIEEVRQWAQTDFERNVSPHHIPLLFDVTNMSN